MFGALVFASALTAGPILQVTYFTPPGVTCSSASSSSADSETLNVGPCTGSGGGTLLGVPYVTATADSFQVSVNGEPGSICGTFSDCSVSIGGSAEFDGSLEAIGGSGPAFIEFEVGSFGADTFVGDFAIPAIGVNQTFTGFGEQRQIIIPVTFGELIPYSLMVQHQFFTWGEPDLMLAGVSMWNLEVVDAAGNLIPGAEVVDPPSPGDPPVPEPGTATLLSAALGVLILYRRTRRY